MGWGDSMISIHDILNCCDYIKQNHKDIGMSLIILDIRDKKIKEVLSEVFDLDFFKSYFDSFDIIKISFEEFNNFGRPNIGQENYVRFYSGRNSNPYNNTPGIFDVYVNSLDIASYNIPFHKFTFDDFGGEVKKFSIFNKNILHKVDTFISKNFKEKFKGVCYRSGTSSVNYDNLNLIINKIKEKLDYSVEYFLCSNSSDCKLKISETKLHLKMYRTVEEHPNNHILDGFPVGDNIIFDAISSVCEMLILGRCEKIYYSGEMNWISYFTWYARNVEKKELVILNNL